MERGGAIATCAGFCIAIGFVCWSIYLIWRVDDRQRELRRRVGMISQLNAATGLLRRMERHLEQPGAGGGALGAAWGPLREKWRRRVKRLRARAMLSQRAERALAAMGAFVAQSGAAGGVFSAPMKRRWRRLRREVSGAARADIRGLRRQLRDISIELAWRWKQLHWLVWISCGLALSVALGLLILLRGHVLLKRREAELSSLTERYELAALGSSDGLWDMELETNTIHLSGPWRELLGYESHELPTTPEAWFQLIHPEDASRVSSEWEAHLKGEADAFVSEHRIKSKDAGYIWVLNRGVALIRDGSAVRAAGSICDITGRDSYHDPLTGLPNRSYLLKHVERALHYVWRKPEELFALLFVDLDRCVAAHLCAPLQAARGG